MLKALEKPFLIAFCGSILFLISSEILAKINTFASTAIPTVRTIPAIPGSVRVPPTTDMIDTTKIKLHIRAMLAERPNNLYLISIKIKTKIKPIIMELIPF